MNKIAISKRLEACYTGAVYDVLREHGYRNCVLPRTITGITAKDRLAGPAFTILGQPDPSIVPHDSLIQWTELLGRGDRGDIMVCQPQDDTHALMGELSAETLQFRGIKGYIVDGGTRDTEFINRIGFPVYARFKTPKDIVGAWRPTHFGEPVTIGSVTIANGDYILADPDGIVVIPQLLVTEILNQVEKVMATENKVRSAILQGIDPKDAYLKFGLF